VRLVSLRSISHICYKAIGFDGSEALIPKSQVFGQDYEVVKSDAYWITSWILEQKSLQYSRKKWTMFNKDGKNIGAIEFEHHKPKKVIFDPNTQPNESLIK
jgi:hypothetical protein